MFATCVGVQKLDTYAIASDPLNYGLDPDIVAFETIWDGQQELLPDTGSVLPQRFNKGACQSNIAQVAGI